MAGPLDHKVALVTGAGSDIGLGRNMVDAFVRAGARVAMMDIDEAALKTTVVDVRELGGKDCAIPIVGDISNPADAERAVKETIEALGGLHILVNNAGTTGIRAGAKPGARAWELATETWTRVISVNVHGAFHMARAALPHLIDQRWGRVIGVTTSLDTMIRAGGAPYGPSKAAHEAFVAILAEELEGSGVTANVLVPGGSTATNLSGPGRDPTGRLKPDVMQAPAVWLASPASDGFNGRRVVAYYWDQSLPIEQRLEQASAPAAWPQLGRKELPTA